MSIKIGSIRRNSGGGSFTNPLLVPLTIDANNIPLLLNRVSSGSSNFIFFGLNGVRDWQIGYNTNRGVASNFIFENTAGQVVFGIPQTAIANGKLLKITDGSGTIGPAVAGTDYVVPSQLTGFIENQNAGAQASANAWIDGQYTASNASYITFLTAGQVSNVDISGGSAGFAFLAQSAAVLGAYWVEVNGAIVFNNQVGAIMAPSIPTDLVRLNELQLPYGTWQNQTAAADLLVMGITSNAADSLYEVATSLNWRGGSAVVQLQVSFTSVDGTTQTKTLFPNGAATGVGGGNVITGLNSYNIFPTFSIWVKASTDITVTVVYVSGTPDYDVSAFVRYIFQVP